MEDRKHNESLTDWTLRRLSDAMAEKECSGAIRMTVNDESHVVYPEDFEVHVSPDGFVLTTSMFGKQYERMLTQQQVWDALQEERDLWT